MTKEEKREYMREYYKLYYKKNKEKILERQKEYNQTHKIKEDKNKKAKRYARYYTTQKGRATYLLLRYKQSDIEQKRGESDLTVQWIVDNIFSKPCHYCGESDWHKIGCDRIDNSKPHTKDNVVPCCYSCNCKKHTMKYDEFIKQNSY